MGGERKATALPTGPRTGKRCLHGQSLESRPAGVRTSWSHKEGEKGGRVILADGPRCTKIGGGQVQNINGEKHTVHPGRGERSLERARSK